MFFLVKLLGFHSISHAVHALRMTPHTSGETSLPSAALAVGTNGILPTQQMEFLVPPLPSKIQSRDVVVGSGSDEAGTFEKGPIPLELDEREKGVSSSAGAASETNSSRQAPILQLFVRLASRRPIFQRQL